MNKQISFPLVADDEIIVSQSPVMDLYEEYDLISNIKGNYQDRFAGSNRVEERQQNDLQLEPVVQVQVKEPTSSPAIPVIQKTQGQLAREQARADLKRKRSADYLQQERPIHKPIRPVQTSSHVSKPKTELSVLADRLSQDHYILADMPQVYSLDKEDREQAKQQTRNSYDFLKKSQVYDYPDRQVRRERQIAAELNLTHMEEETT